MPRTNTSVYVRHVRVVRGLGWVGLGYVVNGSEIGLGHGYGRFVKNYKSCIYVTLYRVATGKFIFAVWCIILTPGQMYAGSVGYGLDWILGPQRDPRITISGSRSRHILPVHALRAAPPILCSQGSRMYTAHCAVQVGILFRAQSQRRKTSGLWKMLVPICLDTA